VSVGITVDTKGGFLYCTGTVSFKTRKVTGGTGAFKGATGTIKGTAVSPVKEAVTITHRTCWCLRRPAGHRRPRRSLMPRRS